MTCWQSAEADIHMAHKLFQSSGPVSAALSERPIHVKYYFTFEITSCGLFVYLSCEKTVCQRQNAFIWIEASIGLFLLFYNDNFYVVKRLQFFFLYEMWAVLLFACVIVMRDKISVLWTGPDHFHMKISMLFIKPCIHVLRDGGAFSMKYDAYQS